jgi:hypothetical protein
MAITTNDDKKQQDGDVLLLISIVISGRLTGRGLKKN